MTTDKLVTDPRTGLIKRFCWFCAGSTIQVLKRRECLADHNKHAAIGSTVFFTAVLAAITGSYALYTSFGSYIPSIAFGIFWGLLILNFDRLIVLSIKKEKHGFRRQLLAATPRLLLAILISFVITTPLELKIFNKEIQEVIASKNEQALNGEITKINERYGISELTTRNAALETEIQTKEQELKRAYQQWDAQLERTRGVKSYRIGRRVYNSETAGDRRLRETRKTFFDRVDTELRTLIKKNNDEIEINKKESKRLEELRATEIEARRQALKESNGLSDRLEAMHKLTSEKRATLYGFLLIAGVFLVIETAPVLAKLMSKYGPYDAIIEGKEYEVILAEDLRLQEVPHRANAEIQNTRAMDALLLQQELEEFQRAMGAAATHPKLTDIRAEVANQILDRMRMKMLRDIQGIYSDTSGPDPAVARAAQAAEDTIKRETAAEAKKTTEKKKTIENAKNVVLGRIKRYINDLRSKFQ